MLNRLHANTGLYLLLPMPRANDISGDYVLSILAEIKNYPYDRC